MHKTVHHASLQESAVGEIVRAFEHLTLESVELLGHRYAPDARFKDPFNDVQGRDAIRKIFRHMFASLHQPRFVVTGRIVQGQQCFLTWEFHFFFQRFKSDQPQCIQGGTHLVLNAQGLIEIHRDYWDAAEELYEKIPVIGVLMRGLKVLANT